jgi:hypothetical protein
MIPIVAAMVNRSWAVFRRKSTYSSISPKLYTRSVPPNHRDSVVHYSHTDTEMDNEHLDGKTME